MQALATLQNFAKSKHCRHQQNETSSIKIGDCLSSCWVITLVLLPSGAYLFQASPHLTEAKKTFLLWHRTSMKVFIDHKWCWCRTLVSHMTWFVACHYKFSHLTSKRIAWEAIKGVLRSSRDSQNYSRKSVGDRGRCELSEVNVDTFLVENKWLGKSKTNAKAVFALVWHENEQGIEKHGSMPSKYRSRRRMGKAWSCQFWNYPTTLVMTTLVTVESK